MPFANVNSFSYLHCNSSLTSILVIRDDLLNLVIHKSIYLLSTDLWMKTLSSVEQNYLWPRQSLQWSFSFSLIFTLLSFSLFCGLKAESRRERLLRHRRQEQRKERIDAFVQNSKHLWTKERIWLMFCFN